MHPARNAKLRLAHQDLTPIRVQPDERCGSKPICRHRKENRRRVGGDNADPRGMTESVFGHEKIHCSFDRGQLNGGHEKIHCSFDRGQLNGDPAGIDEVQRVPDLMSYLQGLVDSRGRMGDFILTGSQKGSGVTI